MAGNTFNNEETLRSADFPLLYVLYPFWGIGQPQTIFFLSVRFLP